MAKVLGPGIVSNSRGGESTLDMQVGSPSVEGTQLHKNG